MVTFLFCFNSAFASSKVIFLLCNNDYRTGFRGLLLREPHRSLQSTPTCPSVGSGGVSDHVETLSVHYTNRSKRRVPPRDF